MNRFVHMVVLAAFLAVGFGVPMAFANEPAPAEQKDKKDTTSGKADDGGKKDEKKDMGGK
jgi:hypothetical protein